MKPKNIYTVNEAAKVAEVTPRTIQRWIYSGKLKAEKAEDGIYYLIKRRELLKTMKGVQPNKVLERIYSATRIYRDAVECTLLVYAKKRSDSPEIFYTKVLDDIDLNSNMLGIDLSGVIEPTKKEKKLLQDIEDLIISHAKGGDE